MSESGVIPPPKDRESLTDFQVGGEICCPDCGIYFAVNCPLEDLMKWAAFHDCTKGMADVPP